jgi:hypothetical protein
VGHPDGIFDVQGYNFCLKNGMGVISGTDMHEPDFVYGWTTLMPQEWTEESIMEELKARRTSLILNALDSPFIPPSPPAVYTMWWLDPFYKVGGVFTSYYSLPTVMYSFTSTPSGQGIFCAPRPPYVDVSGIVTMLFTMVLLFVVIQVEQTSRQFIGCRC